jgi:hypothetical protein
MERFYAKLQRRDVIIHSHLRFQDVSLTDIIVREGTISYGVMSLGCAQTDISFGISVRCAVPTDREEVASVLAYFSSGAVVAFLSFPT